MVIAIARQFGSGANGVAAGVASELGYEYIERQLPEAVAIRLETSLEEVRAREERRRSFGERLLSALKAATPEVAPTLVSADDEVIREIERLVLEYAERGNCVIAGHGATHILRGRSNVLCVLVRASLEWRAARVATWWNVIPEVARAEVERVDRARRAHVIERYRINPEDMGLYHLIIDTEALGIPGAAATIVAAARATLPG